MSGRTLEELYAMNLHDVFHANATDIIIRVPGGWIYTTFQNPVFIPEPRPMITVSKTVPEELIRTVSEEDFESIEERINILEAEFHDETKDQSVPCQSIHSDGQN